MLNFENTLSIVHVLCDTVVATLRLCARSDQALARARPMQNGENTLLSLLTHVGALKFTNFLLGGTRNPNLMLNFLRDTPTRNPRR